MAVGTTDSFNENRDQIIRAALAKVGAIDPMEPSIPDDLRDHAARALDRLVKSLDRFGVFLWRTQLRTLAIVSGTATYNLAATTVLVDDPMNYRASAGATSRSLVHPITQDEYKQIPDRTTPGIPVQYVFKRQGALAVPTVTFWPVPNLTGAVVEYESVERGKDFNDGSTNADFPTKWLKCLVNGLAMEIAPDFKQLAAASFFKSLFDEELRLLVKNDEERGDLYIQPPRYFA